MKAGPHLQALNTPEILQILQSKLPGNLQERWNRKVFGLKRDELRAAEFIDFVNLIEEETRLGNDPLYSREALSEVQNSFKDRFRREMAKDTKMSVYSTDYSSTETDRVYEPKSSCPSCEGLHDLDKCPDYLKLDVKERSKFLYENKLCYACYKPTSPTHVSKSCRQQRTCNICTESHPTGLHGFKFTKRSKYVDTKQSPADDASHDLCASAIAKNSRWFTGPDFLWKLENEWPREKAAPLLKEDDPELKKNVKVNCLAVAETDSFLIELENRYSD
eukprot:gene19358-21278_t